MSHLAGVYATLLSLAIVGGEEAYSLVDRKSMWQWLGRLKQPDGGFRISEGGEEDVRGAYCALVAVSLLNLPLSLPPDSPARSAGFETFFDGLGEYISRCQTYEGGIGASPGNEAHGAYAFCAIACLCLLDSPHESLNRYLNLDELVGWLSSRQYSPEGGLAGRTNKVVDGCYSHWLGGCWPLVQAAISGPRGSPNSDSTIHNLYSSEGLARYILCCCQAEDGGLRDKPSKSVPLLPFPHPLFDTSARLPSSHDSKLTKPLSPLQTTRLIPHMLHAGGRQPRRAPTYLRQRGAGHDRTIRIRMDMGSAQSRNPQRDRPVADLRDRRRPLTASPGLCYPASGRSRYQGMELAQSS